LRIEEFNRWAKLFQLEILLEVPGKEVWYETSVETLADQESRPLKKLLQLYDRSGNYFEGSEVPTVTTMLDSQS
jgi:hypothetical protein